MLFLLDKDAKTVKWNGQPLHETSKAIVSEEINGDYILNATYPITDTRIHKLLKEDMLIIAPTPMTGRQLFRIKEVKEEDDSINLTCPHITEDVFKRSIRPMRVSNATTQTALNTMITQSKTSLGVFTFSSNILEKRTFTTTEVETLYNILLDGKHSIVGTWEGEIIRNNFLIDIQKSRGTDRGVVITTHQSLNKYDRERNSSSVITRIHLKSTFKPEGSEQERTINITIDSPLINDYPYINEAEYENNNLKTEAELRKWGEAKFKNGNIDKPSDKIEIEAYELDGQKVNLGDTVRIMSLKHDVMVKKKAIGYKFDALSGKYLSITFDDKAGIGGSRSISSSISDVASEIINTFNQKNNGNFEKNLQALIENANREFDLKSEALKQEITDGLEQAKARSEAVKELISNDIERRFQEFGNKDLEEVRRKVDEALKKAGTLPDAASLSTSVKREILASPDLTQKVSETIQQTDSGTIYNKIYQNIKHDFVVSDEISPVLAGINQKLKSQTIEFQKLTESNTLYERILGKSETEAPDKLSRLVMSSEIFQTEVGKYSTQGGPNMLRNSRADDGLKYWTEANGRLGFTAHQFYFNGQKRMFELRPGAIVKSPRFIVKRGADYTLNILGFDNNSKYFKIYFCKRKKGSTEVFGEKQLVFDGKPQHTEGPVFNNTKAIKKSFQFNVGNFDDGYLQFEYDRNNPNKWGGLFMTELDFYEGTNDRKWQPAPEDSAEPIEAVKTKVTQLAGSYAIENLNSAGDLINGINLGADGTTRFVSKLMHISGDTLIDNAVIKSAMIDKLKTGNFESGSVTTQIIASNAVTADKLLVDSAMINKLVSNQAFIKELFAQRATITQIQSIDITGEHVRGGRITSLNGGTVIDLQNGWINTNQEGVGIRNQFPGRPLQYIAFGTGRIGDVEGSYTALLSNRNGVQNMDSTSAGVQIWNGRSNGKVRSAITFYGQTMDFLQSAQQGLRSITIDVRSKSINGLDDIIVKGASLSSILDNIFDNFRNLDNNGNYSRAYHHRWH
jgi:phage minor structural protein, N-terminal domain protein